MTKTVIIVAGGSGSRMKADVPKQFILLNGRPLLMYTIDVFYNYDKTIEIILVLPKKHIDYWKSLVKEYNYSVPHIIIEGGEERYYSVKNGLNIVKNDLVAIHDAVRPFVNNNVIKEAFDIAEEKGNAIPVIPVNESVRVIINDENKILNRNNIVLIQTPQCFKTDLIKKAYSTPYKPEFTDDASVLEAMGAKIYLTKGNEMNIKITKPLDLLIAEAIIANQQTLNP